MSSVHILYVKRIFFVCSDGVNQSSYVVRICVLIFRSTALTARTA